jgi:hypothetical protein
MDGNLNSHEELENLPIQIENPIEKEYSLDQKTEEKKNTRREIVLIMGDNKPADEDDLQYLNPHENSNSPEIIKISSNDNHEISSKAKEIILDLEKIKDPRNQSDLEMIKISKKQTEEVNIYPDLLSKEENKALLTHKEENNMHLTLNKNLEIISKNSEKKLFIEEPNADPNTEFVIEKDKEKNQLVVTMNKLHPKEILLSSISSNEMEKKEGNIQTCRKEKTNNLKKFDTKIEMKDSKIKLNIEELEKQYLTGEKLTLEGQFDPRSEIQMQKLREDLKKMHPCIVKDCKHVSYPLFSSTGWFCCGEKCSQSDLEKLGIGMVCYFKILKVFLICFLLITIFNIPLYYIYYNNHTEKAITNYRDALFKTTIGNIASGNNY